MLRVTHPSVPKGCISSYSSKINFFSKHALYKHRNNNKQLCTTKPGVKIGTQPLSNFLSGTYERASTKEGAPTIFFLHGLFENRKSLFPISMITGKAGCNRCLIELTNHGQSHKGPMMTVDTLTQDVAGYMDRTFRDIESFVVMVGFSLGGMVAMNLASKFPEHMDALVVIDIAPDDYSAKIPFFELIIRHLHTLDVRNIRSKKRHK